LIETRGIFGGPVDFSPDGQTLAVWATNSGPCADSFDEFFAVLLNRNGEVIARSDERVVSFDWMPDNRLAFLLNDNDVYKLIIEDERHSFFGSIVATLPPLPGSPSRFRVSPDGTQVLFEVFIGGPVALTFFEFREATVWIMNIDGTNLRQLADTSREKISESDEPLINQPVWSPDSQNVLITENYKFGTHTASVTDIESPTLESTEIFVVNYNYLTYIMPANSPLTLLPPESFSPTGVRPLMTSNQLGEALPRDINPMTRQTWTSAIVQSPTTTGAFPRPNGQVNRGMPGYIYVETYFRDTDADVAITKINLASNEKSVIEFDSPIDSFGGFDVSRSQTRIAMFQRESSDEMYVNIYDERGQILKSYRQANSNYNYTQYGSKVRISPQNEDFVAWPFWNRDNNDQGIVVVNAQTNQIDVFDNRRYEEFSWFPNGDLLLAEKTRVYRARTNGTGFDAPELLFEHVVDLGDIEVSPNGQRLVFHSLGNIFTVNLDGSGLVKVMGSTTHRHRMPAWSPDGQFLLFNTTGSDTTGDVYAYSSKHFVSADAKNIPLYREHIQDHVMEIGEAASMSEFDLFNLYAGNYVWR